MSPFFVDYLERLAYLHQEIVTVLERLPQAALDWKPGPKLNSIAVLVAHTAGSERFWIGDMTVRGATSRVRATEFETSGLDQATLKSLLDQALADSQAAVAQLTLEHLPEMRQSPMDGRSCTVAWCLLHAMEHVATHVGHIQLMGDMWERGVR